jgi:hypothetical protein
MQDSTFRVVQRSGGIKGKLLESLEPFALALVIRAYRKMCDEERFPAKKHETWYSALLRGYIEELYSEYSLETGIQWDVIREFSNDSKQISLGQANPDAAPLIDIVVISWLGLGGPKSKFPFESKRIVEHDSELIRRYIREGLKDRYLNEAKDYSAGLSWGGMIGYILQGSHYTIVDKLNDQVNKQLSGSAEHFVIDQPIEGFDAIYRSRHQLTSETDILTIVHLFLPFLLEEAQV